MSAWLARLHGVGQAYDAWRNNGAVQQRDEADEAWSTSELRSLSLCSADTFPGHRRAP
jgi:hypothetical protein